MIEQFIKKWAASGASERANAQSFLSELCEVLGVEKPHPAKGDPDIDKYVFERDAVSAHEGGSVTIGKIDLYRRGSFILEAKQGAGEESTKLGTAKRGTPAWQIAMRDAFGQALGYARAFDPPPPFLIVCDVGYCFDLYAAFDKSGAYHPFPSPQASRIFLKDLAEHADTLRKVWTEPLALDPSKNATKITRDVAKHLADLAQRLDKKHSPEDVATFLMRCIFTMFAEDVGLIQKGMFQTALETSWLEDPALFVGECESLWEAMNDGGTVFRVGKLLKFNGGLFKNSKALPLDRKALTILLEAAKCNWSEVEPAIFGTLLERALDPRERHRLGAHFTPRAYVERLVRPTIEEPLRRDWETVQIQVRKLVDRASRSKEPKKLESEARKLVREFHQKLAKTRVLDPACGSGNFLYVALDVFKRLEGEVLELLYQLGDKQTLAHLADVRVNPSQFLGIEVKRWAKEIAELVLWIGYLQWHFRAYGTTLPVPEPVLRDYKNIECRDAVLAWDDVEELRDEKGKPVTRWDGVTMKKHPATGEDVPDESARVPVMRYVNPRQAEWPQADFVVGNPPYLGARTIRAALGDGYLSALRSVFPEVPDHADFVMYWWDKAAALTVEGRLRRFGLITTKSIGQEFSRKVVQRHFDASRRFGFRFVIPNHPWVDASDGADVRVALTVCDDDGGKGTLTTVVSEQPADEGEIDVCFARTRGFISADLRTGITSTGAAPLRANEGLSCVGYQLTGKGFVVDDSQAQSLDPQFGRRNSVIWPTMSGRDLTQGHGATTNAIDVCGLDVSQLRDSHPKVFQWLLDRVKPERDHNNRASVRDRWWVYGEARNTFRPALKDVRRIMATSLTARHRFFQFVETRTVCDSTMVMFAIDDAFLYGVMSSQAHVVWSLRAGGRMGVGDDPRYLKAACFDPFPFPACTEKQKDKIRELGEALDALRKKQQSLHPELTITGMYNVLEKLKSGEALTAKEKVIHEHGLVSVLKELHQELDEAVLDAYGWPRDISDDEIIERLVALNAERAAEEKRGKIRWLRPDFQESRAKKGVQRELPGAEEETEEAEAPAGKKGGKAKGAPIKKEAQVWPKMLAEQIAAVRDLLVARPTFVTTGEVAKAFKGAKADAVEEILESLAALGHVVRERGKGEVRWRASRVAA